MELTKEEKHILLHSLGLENIQFYEKEKIINPYRNSFYTSYDGSDYVIIKGLIDKGLMYDSYNTWEKGSSYFSVIEKDIVIAQKLALDNIPKLTRSQKRYILYLHSESDEKFGEWLKNSYWDDYRKQNGV
jgi:hypothetical protein